MDDDRGNAIVTITEHHDDEGYHVALRGRLDVRTVADLRLTLHRMIADGSTPLLLDLGEARVGDATGFGFLVECQRRATRAGRPMRIVSADDRTRRLLHRARLGFLLTAAVGRAAPADPVDPVDPVAAPVPAPLAAPELASAAG